MLAVLPFVRGSTFDVVDGGTKVSNHQPGRDDGNTPQSKVEVYAADLCKEGKGIQPVAESLPGRLGATEEGGVTDDLLLVGGQVLNYKVSGTVSV